MSSRILFLGRQPDHYAPLWRQLAINEVEVAFAASQNRAQRVLEEASVDVIVLDASTLRGQPQQMARALRRQTPEARLILITDGNITGGLSYDYHLQLPLAWRQILHTINEALNSQRRRVLAVGDLVLDIDQHTVSGPAGENRLTPKLSDLLELLMRHPNEPVSRETIMQEVWKTNFLDDTRTLDVHMSWLRREIEPDPRNPQYLRTKRGLGYIFCPNG